MTKVILLSFLCCLINGVGNAQDTCLMDTLYRTDSLGDEKSKLMYPLLFKITTDSIKVYAIDQPDELMLGFKILNKMCRWNKDYTSGYSTFNLVANEGSASLNPIITISFDAYVKHILLAYKDKEPRIFTISKE